MNERVRIIEGASDWMKKQNYWNGIEVDSIDGLFGVAVSDNTHLKGDDSHYEIDLERDGLHSVGVNPQWVVFINGKGHGGACVNEDKMTREEFDKLWFAEDGGDIDRMWNRIDAIQNRPFQPDWSLKPEKYNGFLGHWVTGKSCVFRPESGEFYIPAPHNTTDAELVAMFEKLPIAEKIKRMEGVGE